MTKTITDYVIEKCTFLYILCGSFNLQTNLEMEMKLENSLWQCLFLAIQFFTSYFVLFLMTKYENKIFMNIENE